MILLLSIGNRTTHFLIIGHGNAGYDWISFQKKDIATQENGYDCGPFLCCFARHVVFGDLKNFSENDMPLIRKNILLELYAGELRCPR